MMTKRHAETARGATVTGRRHLTRASQRAATALSSRAHRSEQCHHRLVRSHRPTRTLESIDMPGVSTDFQATPTDRGVTPPPLRLWVAIVARSPCTIAHGSSPHARRDQVCHARMRVCALAITYSQRAPTSSRPTATPGRPTRPTNDPTAAGRDVTPRPSRPPRSFAAADPRV